MKRVKFIIFLLVFSASLLVIRLFYISVIDGKDYARQAISQRTEKMQIPSSRGVIYDRNMIKLTDNEMSLVIRDNKPYYINKNSNNLLSHVIGYVTPDGIGYGIEGAFNQTLSTDEKSSIGYLKDINNNKISKGYSFDINNSYKGVSLTIDYHVQNIVETALDSHKINGAAIVADCKTGEILAMASRPNFDRNNLAEYLNGTNGELLNKAITQYNPGSVFKLVIAAAALENQFTDDMVYNCTGSINFNGIDFVCHKSDGHGTLTMSDGFAHSCNGVFYEIGNTLGIDEIYKYASDFGIGKEVLKINGIPENKGYVPQKITSQAELANVSIGQGDVMMTPLQMADIMCTICNGGIRKQLTLINGIVDEDGKCNKVESSDIGRVVSEGTARRLMNMMKDAVENGTGTVARIEKYGAGGKTGSAETGWLKDGELLQQGWFAGFFPVNSPEYVCVVMAENGKRGSDSACPVFKDIGTGICNIKP